MQSAEPGWSSARFGGMFITRMGGGWVVENEMMFSEKSSDSAIPVTEKSTINELRFTVFGTPVPQGSTRAFIPKGWKRPIITAANAKTKPWRQEIAGAALHAMGRSGFQLIAEGAVSLAVAFYFDKPKSTPKRISAKTTKPDADKLLRSVLDSLTGIAFTDDAQITNCSVLKAFGSPARCEISLRAE